MNMKKSLLAVAMLGCLVCAAHAQRRPSHSGILLDAGKPAVYISFLRTAELEPLRTGYGRKHLLFRITNNTRWSVWLKMGGVPGKEYGDAGLFYTIEGEEKREIRVDERCHVCSINPVGPGRSVVFAVPTDYAAIGPLMRIEYSFAWERGHEGTVGSSSEHSVTFSFATLPESALPSEALSNNGMHPTRDTTDFIKPQSGWRAGDAWR